MKLEPKEFFTIPAWENIPFLVHGFGDKFWSLQDFGRHPQLRKFKAIFLRQIHSDILHVVDRIPEDKLSGDALLTDKPGFLLVVKTADCLPVLIADPVKMVVAAVHCGWKSTSQRLVQKVIQELVEHFQCEANSLLVALGPCIGENCYEVGAVVKREFEATGLEEDVFFPHPLHVGKYYLDLRKANMHQLKERGVLESNIAMVDLCSHCEAGLFSYRRSPQTEGRMLSFIGLIPSSAA